MSDAVLTLLQILVVGLVTAALRGAPYLLFGRRPLPPVMDYLGAVLPSAIMVVLVAYCLRSVDLSAPPYGAAVWVSLLVTVGLHVWRRNTVLSVVAGTVCYMVLIRTVFPL